MSDRGPVFLIYAHTDPAMLRELVLALQPYRVVIHIDAKSDIVPFQAAIGAMGEFTEERVAVYWADYSQVEAIEILLRHVKDAPAHTHLALLSGQDYPVRPIQDFAAHLKARPGIQFARSFVVAGSEQKYLWQVEKRHFRALPLGIPNQLRRVSMKALTLLASRPRPKAPAGLRVCHGQAHWVLTNECAQEVVGAASNEVRGFFRRTFAPDEKYFHSLVASSRFAEMMSDGGPIAYRGPGNWRYTNFHYIDPTLRPLDLDDLEAIEASGMYFARKMTTKRSLALVHELRRSVGKVER